MPVPCLEEGEVPLWQADHVAGGHADQGSQTKDMQDTPKRLIIGISGASGVTYGVRLLQLLRNAGVETHLVMSKTAEQTFAYETDLKIAEVRELANVSHATD